MSKKTSDAERKFSSYELEILAVIAALKKFRVYVLGKHFKLITDCNAFAKTLEKKDLCTRVARWVLFLQEYDYKVEHRSGDRMKHVDALSRYPVYIIRNDNIVTKMKVAQRQDEDLKAVINIVQEKSTFNDFILKGDLLYKIVKDSELLVVPRTLQREIIRNAHERGHFALKKTKDLIAKEYFIPNLEEKIKRHISCCITCIISNRKQGKQEGELHPIRKDDIPLYTYHIDFVGPLETTGKQYKHILVVVDAFTKFCWLYPTKSTSTDEVIKRLQSQSVLFGNPYQIVSDRGSAFTSDAFKQYCEFENIIHRKITTGLPRANGQVERINDVVSTVLTKLSTEDPTKWYKHVEKVQQILNSTFSRSIDMTPFELLVGVKMRIKEDVKLKELIENQFVESFNEERVELRKHAKSQILKTQTENKRSYNLRRKPPTTYKINDLVAIKRTQFGGGLKLKPKYLGPYQVIKVKPSDTYDVIKVGNSEGPRNTTTCAEYMKPWLIHIDSDDDTFEANV